MPEYQKPMWQVGDIAHSVYNSNVGVVTEDLTAESEPSLRVRWVQPDTYAKHEVGEGDVYLASGFRHVFAEAGDTGKHARITEHDSDNGYRGHRGITSAGGALIGIECEDGDFRSADEGCAVLVAPPVEQPKPSVPQPVLRPEPADADHVFQVGDIVRSRYFARRATVVNLKPWYGRPGLGVRWSDQEGDRVNQHSASGFLPVVVDSTEQRGLYARITEHDSDNGYRDHRGVVQVVHPDGMAGIYNDKIGVYRSADPGCAVLVVAPEPAPYVPAVGDRARVVKAEYNSPGAGPGQRCATLKAGDLVTITRLSSVDSDAMARRDDGKVEWVTGANLEKVDADSWQPVVGARAEVVHPGWVSGSRPMPSRPLRRGDIVTIESNQSGTNWGCKADDGRYNWVAAANLRHSDVPARGPAPDLGGLIHGEQSQSERTVAALRGLESLLVSLHAAGPDDLDRIKREAAGLARALRTEADGEA